MPPKRLTHWASPISGPDRFCPSHADRLVEFAKSAKEKGFKVVIAGAGGCSALARLTASMTPLPVFGVPVESKACPDRILCCRLYKCPPAFGRDTGHRQGRCRQCRPARRCGIGLSDAGLAARLDAWRSAQSEKVALHPSDEA